MSRVRYGASQLAEVTDQGLRPTGLWSDTYLRAFRDQGIMGPAGKLVGYMALTLIVGYKMPMKRLC